MKANELRIGNMAFRRTGFEYIIIDEIDITQMAKWERERYCATRPLKPIPLTEEWLLRIRFEKQVLIARRCYSFQYDDRETFDVYEANGYFYFIHIGGKSITIKSIHQLQNLYFAITGEELEIKEQ